MSLSVDQQSLISSIGMQAMSFGMQLGREAADTALMSALKADLHRVGALRNNAGPAAHKTISHHKALMDAHLDAISADLKELPQSKRRVTQERFDDMTAMGMKLGIALKGLVEFAPEEEVIPDEFVPTEPKEEIAESTTEESEVELQDDYVEGSDDGSDDESGF